MNLVENIKMYLKIIAVFACLVGMLASPVFLEGQAYSGAFILGSITGGHAGRAEMRIQSLYCVTTATDAQRYEGQKLYENAKKAHEAWLSMVVKYIQKRWWQRNPADFQTLTEQADVAFDNIDLLVENQIRLSRGEKPIEHPVLPRITFKSAGPLLKNYYIDASQETKSLIITELNKRGYWRNLAIIYCAD